MLTRLKTSKKVNYGSQTKIYGLYICDCGNKKEVRDDHVRNSSIGSCGCNKPGYKNKTHGMTSTITYASWSSMISRVRSKDPHKIKYYKDVKIDPRWQKFELFLNDMGERPSKDYSIDRINNKGNYEPGNCRWATKSEQMKNTRRKKS